MSLTRGVDRWLLSYLADAGRRRSPRRDEAVHLLLCICDHYEPKGGAASPDVARARVRRWAEQYPRRFAAFHDSDGRPPRHTFFYPAEEYEPQLLDQIAELCYAGFGEVEVHLHHDGALEEGLRRQLLDFTGILSRRHGLLARHKQNGKLAYGFIHGNWALNNSRPDGRWCGVNDEISILRQTGCYADFTLPSAPSPTQTRTINRIYYGRSDPRHPKGHDTGVAIGTGQPPADALLLIPGPLLLDWRRRKWGLVPGIENGCLQGNQPPTLARLNLWLRARVQVPSRPDWFFVKLYTHGAAEGNADMLLGEQMAAFHEAIARLAATCPIFHFHYVSAREMYNLARAAEANYRGTVSGALDYELFPNVPSPPLRPVLAAASSFPTS